MGRFNFKFRSPRLIVQVKGLFSRFRRKKSVEGGGGGQKPKAHEIQFHGNQS